MFRAVTGVGLVATAALVLSEEEPLRYAAEDALAREIRAHGAVGVPAYTLLPKGLVRDREKAR